MDKRTKLALQRCGGRWETGRKGALEAVLDTVSLSSLLLFSGFSFPGTAMKPTNNGNDDTREERYFASPTGGRSCLSLTTVAQSSDAR